MKPTSYNSEQVPAEKSGIGDGGSPVPPSSAGTRPPHRSANAAKEHVLVEAVHSTAADVRNALKRVGRELERFGVDVSDRDAIEVVLAECMNNVVEHAYCETAGSRFELKLHLKEDNLYCRVEDDGKPMPGLTLPSGKMQDVSVDLSDLPEGGFGWFLIRELTSDLRYAREHDRNNLMFQIQLGQERR